MAKYYDTEGITKWCFTYMNGFLCVVPQPMSGIIGYPDDCILELFDTEEQSTARILELGLDYSRTDWTP
jgi:hypothetical protein